LRTLIPNCTKVEFQSSGHFTLDDRVNLTDNILDERNNIFYFVFGRPIQTHNLDPKDKAACSEVYAEIQDEMNRGFTDLLRAREKDPFLDRVSSDRRCDNS
jgi:hypothetical protein